MGDVVGRGQRVFHTGAAIKFINMYGGGGGGGEGPPPFIFFGK